MLVNEIDVTPAVDLDEALDIDQTAGILDVQPHHVKYVLFKRYPELTEDGTTTTKRGLLAYVLNINARARKVPPSRRLRIAHTMGLTGSLGDVYQHMGLVNPYGKTTKSTSKKLSKYDLALIHIGVNPNNTADSISAVSGQDKKNVPGMITYFRRKGILQRGRRGLPYVMTPKGSSHVERLKTELTGSAIDAALNNGMHPVSDIDNGHRRVDDINGLVSDGVSQEELLLRELHGLDQSASSTELVPVSNAQPIVKKMYTNGGGKGITKIRVMSDGTIKYDAGILFGQVPKVQWEHKVSVDRRNRITLGLNSVLIQLFDKNILVDTGVGTIFRDEGGNIQEYGLSPTRLIKNLGAYGLRPKDIDVVILSHLHFDHAGGCTRLNRVGEIIPTFPKAVYYAQSLAWEEAQNPKRSTHMYRIDDFKVIDEMGRLELLDGVTEILPGITVMPTYGPSNGHQSVFVNYGGERVVILGDIVPTRYHMNLGVESALDRNPERTYDVKEQILKQAERDGWLLIFPHDYQHPAGYIIRTRDHEIFNPVDLIST